MIIILFQGRVRMMALVVKIFSVSKSAAATIYNLNLLNLLEAEITNANDTLVTLSVLELLYEVSILSFSLSYIPCICVTHSNTSYYMIKNWIPHLKLNT